MRPIFVPSSKFKYLKMCLGQGHSNLISLSQARMPIKISIDSSAPPFELNSTNKNRYFFFLKTERTFKMFITYH